jgi:hypothetical protein
MAEPRHSRDPRSTAGCVLALYGAKDADFTDPSDALAEVGHVAALLRY